MILKKLNLYLPPLGGSQTDTNYSYNLKKKTRHILNYVERECFQKNKYVTNGFRGILILLKVNKLDSPSISISKSLQSSVFFDKLRYDNISKVDEFRTYVEDTIKEGLKKLKDYNIPSEEILDSLKELKANNYINKWTHKKKSDYNRKIFAELCCSLTIEKFELRFVVKIEDKKVFNSIVLETDPDEVAFDHLFKDIIINEDKITITSKMSQPLLEYFIKSNRISYILPTSS